MGWNLKGTPKGDVKEKHRAHIGYIPVYPRPALPFFLSQVFSGCPRAAGCLKTRQTEELRTSVRSRTAIPLLQHAASLRGLYPIPS